MYSIFNSLTTRSNYRQLSDQIVSSFLELRNLDLKKQFLNLFYEQTKQCSCDTGPIFCYLGSQFKILDTISNFMSRVGLEYIEMITSSFRHEARLSCQGLRSTRSLKKPSPPVWRGYQLNNYFKGSFNLLKSSMKTSSINSKFTLSIFKILFEKTRNS